MQRHCSIRRRTILAWSGPVRKPSRCLVAGLVSVPAVRTAALCALVASVPLSLLSGWRAATVHLAAIGSAWAYNAGVKATVVSPLPYAVSFALLPAFVTLGLPGHPWPRPVVMVATALLGVGAHFINTLPDREGDARSGIAGLPQRMSPGRRAADRRPPARRVRGDHLGTWGEPAGRTLDPACGLSGSGRHGGDQHPAFDSPCGLVVDPGHRALLSRDVRGLRPPVHG